MIDLPLYKSENELIRTRTEFYEHMELTLSDDTRSNSIEILGNKVVKFLLTLRGSDAFNPDYGGIALHHTQISEAYIPKLRLELMDDLDRCKDFIINTSEKQLDTLDTESDRLASLNLVDLVYTSRTRIDAYIEIISTSGKHHVVDITANTES